jgi:CheY-like chemotaxis protein
MRIFVLEDSDYRINYFKSLFNKEGIILEIANTVEEGKKLLSTQKSWDVIFLDHDLEGEIYVDSNYHNTGYQLAKYIRQYIEYDRVILHTMNTVGAANMKAVLEDAEIIPFGMLDIKEA